MLLLQLACLDILHLPASFVCTHLQSGSTSSLLPLLNVRLLLLHRSQRLLLLLDGVSLRLGQQLDTQKIEECVRRLAVLGKRLGRKLLDGHTAHVLRAGAKR